MADPFESAKGLLRRAHYHIDDLKAQIDAFTNEKEWAHVIEKDDDGTTDVHKIRFSKRLSEDLPYIVFDVVNNLRAALDHAAFAAAILNGVIDPTSAKFPFGRSKSAMLNNMAGGCKDVPAEIRDVFSAASPYKGGNDPLWAMNDLCNTKKHKILVPVGLGGASIRFKNITISGRARIMNPSWSAEKNELTLFKSTPSGQSKYDAKVAYSIAFDHVDDVIAGKSPVGLLNTAAHEVERILVATEAECRRIGLTP